MYPERFIIALRRLVAPAADLTLGLLGLFESPSGLAARLEYLALRPFSFPRLRLAAAVLAAVTVALAILPMAAAQLPADGGGASGVAASPARATGRLEVFVCNADTKVGIAGLYAGISRPSDQPPRILENVKTEGAGLAHTDLVPGEYKVGVYPRLRIREDVETSVQIVAGRTQRVQLAVVPTAVLSGVIRDEAGQPVEGATAWFSQVSSGKPKSDREGRFEAIADLEVDPHRPVLFAAQSLERRLVAAGEFDPSQPSLAITLQRAASARGRILDDDGAPIEHADVQATEIFRDIPGQGAWGIEFGAEPTDSTGSYVIPCLPAVIGIHISAKAEGYGGKSVVLPMNDTEGTIVKAPDIRLPVAAESVSGVVVDAQGRPVGGAKVVANGVGVQKLIDADENGRFNVNGLMKGSVWLHVFTLGPAPVTSEPREFQTGDQDVRLVAIPVAPAT